MKIPTTALAMLAAFASTALSLTPEPFRGPSSGGRAATAPLGDCFYDLQKWEQLPNSENSLSAQDDACYPFYAEVADDFVGDGDILIGMAWWGTFWNGDPTDPEAFAIRIYTTGEGGVPDALVHDVVVTDFVFTAGDPDAYCANFDSFVETEGVTYRISVTAVFCFPPQWGWATGDGNGQDVYIISEFFGFPEWTPGVELFENVFDVAFVLYNSPLNPVIDRSWSAVKSHYRP